MATNSTEIFRISSDESIVQRNGAWVIPGDNAHLQGTPEYWRLDRETMAVENRRFRLNEMACGFCANDLGYDTPLLPDAVHRPAHASCSVRYGER